MDNRSRIAARIFLWFGLAAVFFALNIVLLAFFIDMVESSRGIVLLVVSIPLGVALLWVARGFRLDRAWARPAGIAFFALLGAGIVAVTVVALTDANGHGDMSMFMGGVLWVGAILWVASALFRRRPQ